MPLRGGEVPRTVELLEDAPVKGAVPRHALRHVVRPGLPTFDGDVTVDCPEVGKLERHPGRVAEVGPTSMERMDGEVSHLLAEGDDLRVGLPGEWVAAEAARPHEQIQRQDDFVPRPVRVARGSRLQRQGLAEPGGDFRATTALPTLLVEAEVVRLRKVQSLKRFDSIGEAVARLRLALQVRLLRVGLDAERIVDVVDGRIERLVRKGVDLGDAGSPDDPLGRRLVPVKVVTLPQFLIGPQPVAPQAEPDVRPHLIGGRREPESSTGHEGHRNSSACESVLAAARSAGQIVAPA